MRVGERPKLLVQCEEIKFGCVEDVAKKLGGANKDIWSGKCWFY